MLRSVNMLFLLYSFQPFATFNAIVFLKQFLLFKIWGFLVLSLENIKLHTLGYNHTFLPGSGESQALSSPPVVPASWQEHHVTLLCDPPTLNKADLCD